MIILRQCSFSVDRFQDKKSIEKISELLIDLQPKNWEKVIMYARVTEGFYEIFFYTKINGKFVKNFDLEKMGYGLTRLKTRKYFDEIFNELLLNYRKNKWQVCTFILNKDGKVSLEYEYENRFNDFEQEDDYKKEWKKKYLGIK